MNDVYAKGGNVAKSGYAIMQRGELRTDAYGKVEFFDTKEKALFKMSHVPIFKSLTKEEKLKLIVPYTKDKKFADGGMFEENDGFMKADNEFNYRYPTKDVYIETLDEPIDLTSTVTIKSNEVVISPIDENIDLNDDNRIRARMTQSNRGSAENFGKINPRAFEFIDLPMPTSNTHKND
jgi:hypothetical protein